MKFNKKHQTYLFIVLVIIMTSYFIKLFFFNKNKKTVEGNASNGNTYYRIDFNFEELAGLPITDAAEKDTLKRLLLVQFDSTEINNDDDSVLITTIKNKLDISNLVINFLATAIEYTDNTIQVTRGCDMREFFYKQAQIAANTTIPYEVAAAAALDAYNYARFILAVEYKDDTIFFIKTNFLYVEQHRMVMALIAAADLLARAGQASPNINALVNDNAQDVARTNVGEDVDLVKYTKYSARYAWYAIQNTDPNTAAHHAAFAAAYAYSAVNGVFVDRHKVRFTNTYKTLFHNIYNKNPANLKKTFITAAGLIYQNVYTFIIAGYEYNEKYLYQDHDGQVFR
jgi:hypothetical protein